MLEVLISEPKATLIRTQTQIWLAQSQDFWKLTLKKKNCITLSETGYLSFLCWIWSRSRRWRGIFPSSGFLRAARPCAARHHPHIPQTLGTARAPLARHPRAFPASTADGDRKTRRLRRNAWSQHSRETVCCVHLRKRPSQVTTISSSNTLTVKCFSNNPRVYFYAFFSWFNTVILYCFS